MRILGILFVLGMFPVFLTALRSTRWEHWAIFALGALPILEVPLNLDAALISWTWPGYIKGIIIAVLDSLSMAICVRFGSKHRSRFLICLWMVFIASLLPGLFVGELFQPAVFVFFQALRVGLYSYACFLITIEDRLLLLARGVAVAVILNGVYAISGSVRGLSQAPGLLGHQNLTGLTINLCVPLLVALGLASRGGFYLLAVGAAGASALAGGSRATIIFYGLGVLTTLIGSTLVKPTSRKIAATSLGIVAMVLASPLAIHKLDERGSILDTDQERAAFERAAHSMIQDHPWGVGLNQYVVIANTQGYMDRAGVRWGVGARSTDVHNFYLLARTEGGAAELFGVLLWLLLPLVLAFRLAMRRTSPHRDLCVAAATALGITAIHNRYEWIFVTAAPQYLAGALIGLIAALHFMSRSRSKAPSKPISLEDADVLQEHRAVVT